MILLNQSKIKKHHHHVHKDRPKIKQLDDIIQHQEELIIKLQKELIELRKLVEEKRTSQSLYDMASPPTATPTTTPTTTLAASPAATPTATPATTQPQPQQHPQ